MKSTITNTANTATTTKRKYTRRKVKLDKIKFNKSYNKEQIDYLKAVAKVEALENEINELEKAYCKEIDARDRIGNPIVKTWAIGDDKKADKAIEEFSGILKELGLEQAMNKAEQEKRIAEKKLLDFAFSVMPIEVRKTLRQAATSDYKVREKIIETILLLDVSSVSMGGQAGNTAVAGVM